MTGSDAFNIFKPEERQDGKTLRRICTVISDQTDDDAEANYALDALPPNHHLLAEFELGSNQWFRAVHAALLAFGDSEDDDDWSGFVVDLQEWLTWHDHLRLRPYDVLVNALGVDWPFREYSLPEAKQNPVWSFPQAMAWIATGDYLPLARLGVFHRSERDDQLVTDGVADHASRALGWLQTRVAFGHCTCGAVKEYWFEAPVHCTCLSRAWEALVKFSGGLTEQTPELVFSADERWVSMTWPEGADKIRYLRGDILDRWPERSHGGERPEPKPEHSTISGEEDCRRWLAQEFASDPKKRRSKKEFREAALKAFAGRLSERGFNLRVWPKLAQDDGRDVAGAKKKL
jgi:hypothetical protein